MLPAGPSESSTSVGPSFAVSAIPSGRIPTSTFTYAPKRVVEIAARASSERGGRNWIRGSANRGTVTIATSARSSS